MELNNQMEKRWNALAAFFKGTQEEHEKETLEKELSIIRKKLNYKPTNGIRESYIKIKNLNAEL